MTTIEWCDETWNPTVGCEVLSPGCAHCYAMTMARRLALMGQAEYAGLTRTTADNRAVWTGEVRTLPQRLAIPLGWRKPREIFVDSMSDLFHPAVPFEFIAAVYGVMAACPQHRFQLLTKRPERRADWFRWAKRIAEGHGSFPLGVCVVHTSQLLGKSSLEFMPHWQPDWPAWPLPNVWEGTSVENRKHGVPRIDVLRQTPAAVRFLSIEPLLEDLGELDLTGIDWVIAGAESGHRARPMHEDWVRSIRDQCIAQGVRFFFKQRLDARGRKVSLPVLDGKQWAEMPEVPR